MEIEKFWRFIVKRKKVMLIVALPLVAATLVLSFIARPVYKNTALVWIDTKSLQAEYTVQAPESMGKLKYVSTSSVIDTFRGLLGSTTALQGVVKRLDLKDGGGRPVDASKLYNPGTVGKYLRQRLGVELEEWKDSELIEITAYGRTAQEATDIANALVDSFLEMSYNMNKGEAAKASKALEKQYKEMEAKWHKAESEKKDFMNNNDILSFEAQKSNLLAKIKGIEDDLYNNSKSISKSTTGLEETAKLLKEYPEFNDSAMVEDLNNLVVGYKTKLADLSVETNGKLTELTEEHPDVVYYRKKIDEYRKGIKEEAERIVTSKTRSRSNVYDSLLGRHVDFKVDIVLQEISREYSEKELRKLNRDIKRLNELDTQYVMISYKTDQYLAEMRALYSKYSYALLVADMDIANALVIDRAIMPAKDSLKSKLAFPKKGMMLFVSLVVGGMFGFTAMVAVEAVDHSIQSLEDLSACSGPVLGSVPFCKDLSIIQPAPLMERPVREVLSAAKLNSGTGKCVVLPVTSLGQGAGATTLSRAFAEILSLDGYRVLVLDADLEGKSLSRSLGMDNLKGFAEFLLERTPASMNVAQIQGKPNMHVLAAGLARIEKRASAEEIASSLMEAAGDTYDVIVIDLPSASLRPRSIDLLRAFGSALVVVAAGQETREKVGRFSMLLDKQGVRPVGFVLNRAIHSF